jgi:hypothetical protein
MPMRMSPSFGTVSREHQGIISRIWLTLQVVDEVGHFSSFKALADLIT